MSDTIFHKIIRREIPADIVYEDEHLIAFRDIAPQAPVHVLFVPKADIATLNELQQVSYKIAEEMYKATGSAGGPPPPGAGGPSAAPGSQATPKDDVVDAEFRQS